MVGEIAAVVAFVVGPDPLSITGADILLDGGTTSAMRTNPTGLGPEADEFKNATVLRPRD